MPAPGSCCFFRRCQSFLSNMYFVVLAQVGRASILIVWRCPMLGPSSTTTAVTLVNCHPRRIASLWANSEIHGLIMSIGTKIFRGSAPKPSYFPGFLPGLSIGSCHYLFYCSAVVRCVGQLLSLPPSLKKRPLLAFSHVFQNLGAQSHSREVFRSHLVGDERRRATGDIQKKTPTMVRRQRIASQEKSAPRSCGFVSIYSPLFLRLLDWTYAGSELALPHELLPWA